MIKRNCITALFALASFNCLCQEKYQLFISPSGNDKNPGTLAKPFLTTQRAMTAVKVAKAAGKYSAIEVLFRKGEYFLSAPLVFAEADGGNEKTNIVYKAYNDEMVKLHGGKQITGWQQHNGNIYRAPVKGLNFRQLYVDGLRAVRSREPDTGYYQLKAWDVANKKILIESDQISNWKNFQQCEAVIQMYWAESYVHLKSFDVSSVDKTIASVSIADREAAILFPRPYPQKSDAQWYHVENAFEFMDEPNEWYLDRSMGMLYYIKPEGLDINKIKIIAPVTETLLKVNGTLEKPIRNLSFEGFCFEYSNWSLPNDKGFVNGQAGMYNLSADENNMQYVARPAAAVSVTNAHNINFTGNVFQHLGSTAIDLESGTQQCKIIGNIIRDVSGNGVMVGAFSANLNGEYHEVFNPTDKREVCTNDQIKNNHITKTGRDYYGTCGIAAGYPAEIKIENNYLADMPYTGISVGFGWTYDENAMHHNKITNNEVEKVMQVLADGAGIYTLSFQPGTIISGNYIHDIKRSPWAGEWPVCNLYLDWASGGTEKEPLTVENNVLLETDILGVRQVNMHVTGIVKFYKNYSGGDDSVQSKAGLQEPFKKILLDKLSKLE